jgi:4-hydroxy-tetrahydrodipicolinate synthase
MGVASGVYVAAITPRRSGPEIDLAGAFELLDFLGGTAIGGIALLGSTGEFPHFRLEDRSRLVSLVVKRSRLPVLAGVGHSTFDGVLALSREAFDAGASGLLVMPPYFFRYGPEEIKQFYLRLAEEMKAASPVYLYNIPPFTSAIPVEIAIELLATGQFAGIKDSSASWEDFQALSEARARRPFALLVGHDLLFARARAAGADGIVSGVACAVPELLVALDRALLTGKAEAARQLDCRLQEFLVRMDAFPAPVAIRQAVALRGLRTGPPAVPPGSEAQRRLDEFGEWFLGWLPEVQKEASL